MDDVHLETIRSFANTRDEELRTDALAEPAGLVGWLTEAGLDARLERVSRAELARAVAVRDALRGLLLHHNGVPLDPGDVAALDRQCARSRIQLGFSGSPPARVLEPQVGGVDGALGRLLVLVADAVADGTLARLKLCRAADCRWAFLDGSRNGSRHWCAMRVCGNREKVRAYRARNR